MSGVVPMALLMACLNADPNGLSVGEKVPEFEATAASGETWKSSDHVGKGVLVVYFYPADMTGGCTAQACAFRDKQPELKKAGVEVVGVSGDSAENHRIFKKTHDLNFTLLADSDGKLAKLFGVPTRAGGEIVRTVQGEDVTLERGVTAARWTFVIGPDGKIVYRDTSVTPAQDAAKVLEVVSKLKASTSE